MLFTISQTTNEVAQVSPESFVDLKIWERRDIQEWVVRQPWLLGEHLLVVTTEFSRFDRSNNRLDVMAVDEDGNLVIIELKRDQAAGYADLQALRYAAMTSTLTLEDVAKEYAAFHSKMGTETTEAEATQIIREFITIDDPDELASFQFGDQPRIILASENFGAELTTTVLWLATFKVRIKCIRLTPYMLDGRLLVSSQTIIPLQEASAYQVGIQRKEEAQAQQRARRQNTTRYLLENGLLKAGDTLLLRRNLPAHIIVKPGNPMLEAVVTGETGKRFLKWSHNGEFYAISGLTSEILRALHPDRSEPKSLNGNIYWVTAEDGPTLWEMMERHLGGGASNPDS